ncbi:hypothetical protein [Magnetovibrio sp.]|uniref:hypothetical protein n=1 Tax=Magnetovibrio sp. TaxID=2024836 RepID=UPI002F954C55
MSNRLALMGILIAGLFTASPSVAAAQNPWRADPQASGQYMPKPSVQAQVPKQAPQPKYAPLDGRIDNTASGYPGYPAGGNVVNGLAYGGVPYQGALAYPGTGYAGLGYPSAGYPSVGYPGVGYPGLGYSGLGYPGIGVPGLGLGSYPYNSWGNGFGGPMSWMPFW